MVPTYLKKVKKITVERQVDLKDFNKPVHFLQDNVRSKRMKSSNTFFFNVLFIHKLRQEAWITQRVSSTMRLKNNRERRKEKEKEEVCAYKKLLLNMYVLFRELSSIFVTVCAAYK